MNFHFLSQALHAERMKARPGDGALAGAAVGAGEVTGADRALTRFLVYSSGLGAVIGIRCRSGAANLDFFGAGGRRLS